MEYGMIRGESNGDYHGKGCVSASTIKDFIKRPSLYWFRHVAKLEKKEASDAMRFGSSFHEFILEPEKFKETHAFLPPSFNGRTKEGKELKSSIEESGKIILEQSDYETLIKLRSSIQSNKLASILLTNGEPEISWRIDCGLFAMQSRTDWFIESANDAQVSALKKHGIKIEVGQSIIIDLKTTQDLDDWSLDNYGNSIWKFGYHLQLAFYLAVVNEIRKREGKEIVRHFLFVVVEKQSPYECAVVPLTERSFGLAQSQLKPTLAMLSECYRTGKWNSYNERELVVCGIPAKIASYVETEIFNEKKLENPSQW